MSKPIVSIVVLNWNGQRFLHDLFTCVEKQSYPKDLYEVIMVDNDSQKDDSVEYVEKNFHWVKLIKNGHNDGFAKGSNIGIKAAIGEYIVLLNNDTKPEPDWLSELINVAVKKKAGAVVSKLMFDKKRGIINNAGGFLQYDKTWPVIEQGINEKDEGQFEEIQEITAFCGASVLLNRKMLEQIGLFDENFFMYFEDTDLSWRGQRQGWKYYLAPKSIVYHVHAGSSGEGSPIFNYYVSRNRILILFKNARITLALRGLVAVLRDRLWKGLIQLVGSIRLNRGRRAALANLWLGIRVIFSIILLLPTMILKRIGLMKERGLAI